MRQGWVFGELNRSKAMSKNYGTAKVHLILLII
jgi:hypothetical protein